MRMNTGSYIGDNGTFSLMKNMNLEKVYKIILLNNPTSRIEISKIAGLNQTTVSHCVKFLLEKGIIEEVGIQGKSVGRPPTSIVLRRQFGAFVGIEINVTGTKILVTDIYGKELLHKKSMEMHRSPAQFLDILEESILEIRAQCRKKSMDIAGIGIAVIGSFNMRTGVVEHISTMSEWKGYALEQAVNERIPDIPILFMKTSIAGVWGEIHFGRSNPMENLVFINGGWGLTLGVYMHGNMLYGDDGYFGRFGHTTVEVHGRECACGARGCLDAYASVGALIRNIYGEVVFQEKYLTDIREQWDRKDPIVVRAMDEALEYLGIAAANLVNTFNPGQLVFGGLLPTICRGNMERIKQRMNETILPHYRDRLTVSCSSLEEYGPAYGCVAFVREKLIGLVE